MHVLVKSGKNAMFLRSGRVFFVRIWDKRRRLRAVVLFAGSVVIDIYFTLKKSGKLSCTV